MKLQKILMSKFTTCDSFKKNCGFLLSLKNVYISSFWPRNFCAGEDF